MTHAPSPALARARPADAALRALRRDAPVLPVVLLVALLALPAPAGGEPAGGGGTGTLADAVSALVVGGCAVHLARTGRRPLTRTAAVLLGLPVIGVTVAAFGASSAATGVAGAARYLQIFVLVPAAVLMLVRDARQFRIVAWALVALALWQGAIGVRQNLTGTGASYAGEDIRAVGTFGSTDVMGMATVVSYGLVCALALAFRPHAPRQRSAAVTCAVLLTVPLALSFSRGAWIATAAACTAVLFLAGARRAGRVLLAGGAAAVVLVAGLGVGSALLQERLGSITQVTGAPDQSVVDRYTMWAASADMWREHPVTGVGLKGFPDHRDGHASLALSSASDTAGAGSGFVRQPLLSPHNMYLLVLAEQGLLGLAALAGGWAALLVLGLRAWHGERAGRGGSRPDCALLACGLLVWQLVDFVYADIGGPSTVLTAVMLGMVAWWSVGPREEAARG
ncbi:O-antigen ligase domain-containing protein [Streptomyces alfalfae]|uniref:O-antigen ligase family protein n=1 Tax=Streptomyces alfalfae TaxID=1642299 RepID=A0A4Q7EY22_9ACTN|nr:O-antigen ligase domain-containing protein [Streptomyces fradiae]QQC90506.1 O-antigen ligase family protein [Streptomyces alfalfae]RXX44812.1 O-antigen ligase domain-containing protein [Streptomyces alfalfae]RZM95393.1 O-antigen ligase domain-containing protein [Streptomyces alfalfae]